MKKSIALFLSVFYLIFSLGSLRAEASLQESKESQENIFSVKQSEESSVSHFAETPAPKKSAHYSSDQKVLSEVVIASSSHISSVPLFLKHCNFRR